MSDDVAISADGIYKTFKLPHERQTSVKGALINLVRGGKRSYERQEVLRNVSFEVKKGEFFGIVGRNGSGKSTMLKLLAGIYTPDAGILAINGSLTPFIELGVGFNPELSGRENIFLNGALLGFNRREVEAMYDDIVQFAELERFMDQKLKNYSSGMQVRLAFSIAVRAQSDILLLDEVLAVGDSAFQKKCFSYFRELKQSGKTVVFISHDMNSVRQFCDRVLVIDKGEARGTYSPSEAAILYEEIMDNQPEAGLEDETKQLGDRRVRIASVRMAGNKNVASQGDELTLHIKLSCEDSELIGEPIVVGIGFADERGVNVLGPNTQGKLKLNVKKHMELTAVLPHFPLSGNYNLNVGLFSEDLATTYNFIFGAVQLRLLPKDVSSSGGIVYYDSTKWSEA